VRVRADIYPYVAGSANLSQLLPGWAHEGGTAAMVARLRTPADRKRIRSEWRTTLAQEWSDILVCWVRQGGDQSVVGKRVSEIAAERSSDPDAVALDLIAIDEDLLNIIDVGRCVHDLYAVLPNPDPH